MKISRVALVALVGAVLTLVFHQAIASYFCNIAASSGAIDQLACPIAFGAYGRWLVVLTAYPNNPAARKAIKAQAKCKKAM